MVKLCNIFVCWVKYCTLGVLQMEINFLRVLKFKIRVPENLVSGADSLFGLQMAIFLMCPRMACPLHVCGERAL